MENPGLWLGIGSFGSTRRRYCSFVFIAADIDIRLMGSSSHRKSEARSDGSSASGPKRTFLLEAKMSAFGCKAFFEDDVVACSGSNPACSATQSCREFRLWVLPSSCQKRHDIAEAYADAAIRRGALPVSKRGVLDRS